MQILEGCACVYCSPGALEEIAEGTYRGADLDDDDPALD